MFQWRKFNFFDVTANVDSGRLAEALKVRTAEGFKSMPEHKFLLESWQIFNVLSQIALTDSLHIFLFFVIEKYQYIYCRAEQYQTQVGS